MKRRRTREMRWNIRREEWKGRSKKKEEQGERRKTEKKNKIDGHNTTNETKLTTCSASLAMLQNWSAHLHCLPLPPSPFLLLLPPTFSLPQRTSSSVTSFLCASSLSSPIICKFLCPECNDVAWPPPKPEVLLLSHFLPSFPSLFLFFPLPFLASSLPSSCSSTSIPPPSFVFSF